MKRGHLLVMVIFQINSHMYDKATYSARFHYENQTRCILCLKNVVETILFKVMGMRSRETVCKDCLKEYLDCCTFLKPVESYINEVLNALG